MADPVIAERGDAYRQEIPLKRFGKPSEVASVIRFPVLARRILYHRPDHHHRWRDY